MEEEEDVEELGERLYKLIYPGYSNMAGKLTGMSMDSVSVPWEYAAGIMTQKLLRMRFVRGCSIVTSCYIVTL